MGEEERRRRRVDSFNPSWSTYIHTDLGLASLAAG